MEIEKIPIRKSRIGKIWDYFLLKITARVFAIMIAVKIGLQSRERMSHNNGIGASGKFICNPDPELPSNDFWIAGKEFPLKIRHAMATFYDDAMGAIRSISIKLSDELLHSPFDLNLNTGRQSLFWNAASFIKLATMRKERYGVEYQEFYRYYPEGRDGAIATLRRNPTSFTNLSYYSKTPLKWVSKEGEVYYVKYRVIPFDPVEESGLITGHDLIEPENQRIIPGERRNRNYLKREFTNRLRKKEVIKYRFQAQVRKTQPDDTYVITNCCIEWGDEKYPYRDLGTLVIDQEMSWDDSNLISFSMINLPLSLGTFKAVSLYDPHSLNYMREVAELARSARWFSYRWKGLPPNIPDDNYRNSSTIIESDNKMKSKKFPVWHKH